MNRIAQALMVALALYAGALHAPAVQAHDEFRGFSQAELDQMLAPIALFPDTVLSHVLIAATYPIEVVRAARWTRQNPGLSGEQAVNAVIGQDWDPSVMALVAFPDLLARMDGDLDWTQRLGDAFLIQEADVLDSIQRLRAQAYSAGHLRTTEHVRVIREREVIYIEPPRRQVVFVPMYDTRVVFGSWGWAHHPPVFWHAPPRRRSSVVVYWGPAFHVPPAFFFSSFHWPHRQVVVVHHHHHFFQPHRPRHVVHHHHHHYSGRDLSRHQSAQRWQHDPNHRRGVAYHPAVDERHRQLERRSPAPVSSAPAGAPVRVAETRNDQRAWAEARRSENLLPSSDRQTARATRSIADQSRAAAARSTQSSRLTEQAASPRASSAAAATQRPSAAGGQRSPERAVARAAEPRVEAGSSARAVERQLQSRSAAPRDNSAAARSTAPTTSQSPRSQTTPDRQSGGQPDRQMTAPARPTQDIRMAPRAEAARPDPRQIQGQMQGDRQPSTRPSVAAPRASAPDSRPPQAPQRPAAPARESSRSVRQID